MQEENEEEIWKDVVGYTGLYKVSNLGRVKRLQRVGIDKLGRKCVYKEMMLKPNPIKGGYYQLKLTSNKEESSILLHRIVCEAFHGSAPKGKPFVNHKLPDKTNNSSDNIEWCSFKENMDHAVLHGLRCRGTDSHHAKLTEDQVLEICRMFDVDGISKSDLARKYNTCHSNIRSILSGGSWNWLTNRK